jgi:phage terminase large subunit-like protein
VLEADWPSWAHEGQTPGHDDWRVWVLLAGRGFGKTRAGAEWVSAFARANPGAAVALVGATVQEARAVMVEGRSGLLAVARPEEREAMVWEPSRRRLAFASGAEAFLYSAANPESLRGPEHHIAWCDELAKWRRGQATWDNLRLGLRLGERPRALVTTTPKPVAAVRRVLGLEGVVLTGGATRANPHLPDDFVRTVEAAHKGTRFGRQELEGALLDDVEGALWTRDLIEKCRAPASIPLSEWERGLLRVVVGVDPPASAAGTCGIVVCAMRADGGALVLADCSAAGLSPEGWARKVAGAAEAWGAHRVVAEKNNGGTMVEAVLRGAQAGLPVTLVHAADGKAARAEPVAVLFENGRAGFAGAFPELEDELAGFTAEGWRGEGASPDRADAMIWALTELAVKPARAPPRIVGL